MNNEEKILSTLEKLTVTMDTLATTVGTQAARVDALTTIVGTLATRVDALSTAVQTIQDEQAKTNERLDILEAKVDAVKADTAAIFEQTVNLTEFKTEITQKVDDMLDITKENTYDIARMKARRA